MLKFIAGFIAGIYVTQKFGDQVPDVSQCIEKIANYINNKIEQKNKADKTCKDTNTD
jgi:hypothetical protein